MLKLIYRVLYAQEKKIFKQKLEHLRLSKLVSNLDNDLNELKKELEYYKSENFRKDDLLKGK